VVRAPSQSVATGAIAGVGVGVRANAPDCPGIISVVEASNADPAAALGLIRPFLLVITTPLIVIVWYSLTGGRAGGRRIHLTLALTCSKCCALTTPPRASVGLAG
jgi:hypothetical protein